MVNENFWKELWEILWEVEEETYGTVGLDINKEYFEKVKKRLEKLLTKNN